MQIITNSITFPDFSFEKLAVSIFCRVDMIFTASDGNKYYINVGKGEISEAVRDFELIEFANNNTERWEIDTF